METKPVIVCFQSRYGTTETYARWIADALSCPCKSIHELTQAVVDEHRLVVYGGGLYAGNILGQKRLRTFQFPDLAVFTVGLLDPAATNHTQTVHAACQSLRANSLRLFHLPGAANLSKMRFLIKPSSGSSENT